MRTSSPIRIVRVIARLNMGGPAHHVGLLGSRLDPERYETLLLHGELGAGEDSLEDSVASRPSLCAAALESHRLVHRPTKRNEKH